MLASVDTALTFPSFCSPKCEIECLPERMREDGIERVRQKERGRVGETEKRNGGKKDLYKAKREIQYHMNQTVQIVAVLFHLWIRVLHMTTRPGMFSCTHAALSKEQN